MTAAYRTPCGTCSACCRAYLVPLCGHDVWLISQRESMNPAEFAFAIPQEPPRSDGFLLSSDAPPYGLVLDKRGRFRLNAECVFLLRLVGGHDRCGIYEHRPVVCQAYPMQVAPGGVVVETRALCPPDGWSEEELTKRSWRRAVTRTTMQFDLYSEVVARWNARVRTRPSHTFALTEYYSYLINLYERVSDLDRQLDETARARLELTWGYVPDPARSKLRLADFLWPEYLASFRAIVDDYFPEIPPEPWPPILQSVTPSASRS